MAIYDPKIEVVCDGCGETDEVTPEYVYRDYSGKNGYYDCSDEAIEKKLASSDFGWTVSDGKHYCEDCKPTSEQDETNEPEQKAKKDAAKDKLAG